MLPWWAVNHSKITTANYQKQTCQIKHLDPPHPKTKGHKTACYLTLILVKDFLLAPSLGLIQTATSLEWEKKPLDITQTTVSGPTGTEQLDSGANGAKRKDGTNHIPCGGANRLAFHRDFLVAFSLETVYNKDYAATDPEEQTTKPKRKRDEGR